MKILLKHANIYGGETADILVEDGRITGIGSFDVADEIHDMSGFSAVLPGVIDAHMHIVTGDIEYNDRALRAWAQAGVTTVRDLGMGNDKNDHPTEEFLRYRETVEVPECAHCLTAGRFVAQYHGLNHVMSDGAETGYGCRTPAPYWPPDEPATIHSFNPDEGNNPDKWGPFPHEHIVHK